jgi:ADP-ribose pyrophosphatase
MSKEIIYNAKNFTLCSEMFVNEKTGDVRDVTYIEQPAVAIAVPILADGRIVLAEQWRPLIGKTLVECPGGKLEPGESPESALRRELSEEIGLRPTKLRPLIDFYSSVGASTEHIYCYEASGLMPAERRAKDVQRINLRYFSEDSLRLKLSEMQFQDGKTYVALSAYFSAYTSDKVSS